MDITISKSKNPLKKYDAVINNKKKVSFGDPKYQDYTQHKDPDRKANYIARHKKNEKWGREGVDTAGFWAKNLIWNKPTLKASIDDINKRFKNLNVTSNNNIIYN